MDNGRARSILSYATYLAVLIAGIFWSMTDDFLDAPQLDRLPDPYVDPSSFRMLMGIAIAYVLLRAYLALCRGFSRWRNVRLAIDLVLITCAVHLSGRLDSDASMLYFWPLVTSAVERRTRVTLGVGIAIVVLLTLVVGPDAAETGRLTKLGTQLLTAIVATVVAYAYCRAEVGRVEELARLREQVALSDYRSRLSQEMHDGIQHYLVRIATRLRMADVVAASEPQAALRIASKQVLTVQQASDELRYLVQKLRSPDIDQRGFLGAMEDHLALFGGRSGTAAEFQVESDPVPLKPDVEQAAFRIAQEALTNTEKYAQAEAVSVRLRFLADSFECIVADDGVGFDSSAAPGEPTVEGGFGLPSMQERAASVDGSVDVSSAPNDGTTITLTVPDPYEDDAT